jgi:TctA family transporter
MVLLLGAFQLLGLEPGARFLKTHMDLAIGLTLTLAAANLLSAIVMLALARPLVLVSALPGRVLAPVLLAIVLLGVYAVDGSFMDVGVAFLFGGLGLVMQGLGYARAALVLGFVLGHLIETYFSISMQAYGSGFLLRPTTLAIGLLLLAGMFWRPAVQMLVRRR